jgi:hypothetical protein
MNVAANQVCARRLFSNRIQSMEIESLAVDAMLCTGGSCNLEMSLRQQESGGLRVEV